MTKVISTRHIRHDWNQWVDWQDQKTSMTLCGSRSRVGLCGIPGVTAQQEVVEKDGKRVWGWCMRCASRAYRDMAAVGYDEVREGITTAPIAAMYGIARRTLAPQVLADYRRRRKQAEANGRITMANHIGELIKQLLEEYPDLKK